MLLLSKLVAVDIGIRAHEIRINFKAAELFLFFSRDCARARQNSKREEMNAHDFSISRTFGLVAERDPPNEPNRGELIFIGQTNQMPDDDGWKVK